MAATIPQTAVALRNVLAATDFSSCSDLSLLHAVAVAHHYGSTLHVVHVVPNVPFSLLPPEAYPGTLEAECLAQDLARADAQALLTEVLRRSHCEDLDQRIWVQLGAVGETLCALIRHEHIDLAVVGTHGRTGLQRAVLGSVAEEVFRHASCPVLTVGPRSWLSDPQSAHLKHILFPTDLSAESARALPLIMTIACEFGAAVTILSVVEHLDAEAKHDRARVLSVLEQRMRDLVSATEFTALRVDYQIELGNVADCVIETAERLAVDLVAFGLKAPDRRADRLPWKHAYKVVCEVACPVLSLRGPSEIE